MLDEMYRRKLTNLSQKAKRHLVMFFGLHKITRGSIYERLNGIGIGQSEIVLSLLSENYLADVETIVGKPITYLPPDPALVNKPYIHPPRQSRIRIKNPEPRLQGTRAQRWTLIRNGMTLQQLQIRGVTAKDLRCWQRKHYVEIR